MWHHDLFHKQNSLECSMCLLHQFWRGRGWWRRGCLNGSHAGAIPFWGEMGSTWNCTFNWGSDHSCMSKAKDFICVFTKRLTEITWEGFPVLKMSAQHPALQASPNIVDYFKSNSASFVLCSTVLDEEQWWGRTISFRWINSPFSPKQMISLSLIDVGGQSWMLVSSSGPSGLGALSLQRPPYGILPEGIRCCRIFRLRVGQGSLGCNYTCVCGGGEVFWGERDWDDASISEGGPPPLHPDTDPPASLSVAAHASRPGAPSPSLPPCSDNRMGFNEELDVAPTPVTAAKQAPRAASSHFITLHQIKSNKLITNGSDHASSKYRINIIDLILSVVSEKHINAEANIKVLFSRATVTIG